MSLEALVADLASKVSRLTRQPQRVEQTVQQQTLTLPHWEYISFEGGTFTGGTDWEPQFYDVSGTERVVGDIPTISGSFEWGDAGPSYGTLFVIQWDSDQPYTANIILTEGVLSGAGTVQVHFNGTRNEYTVGQQVLALDVKRGRNVLKLIRPHPAPDSLQLNGRLFEPSKWVKYGLR